MNIPADIAMSLKKIALHPQAKHDLESAMLASCLEQCGYNKEKARTLIERIVLSLKPFKGMTFKQLAEANGFDLTSEMHASPANPLS